MKKQIKDKHIVASILKNNLINLPTPSTISYMWNIGSLLGITLVIQIMTGVMLAIHYSSAEEEAFNRTIFLTRNINMGALIRATHSNIASIFFALIYVHIFRGLINSSFKKIDTWASGITIVMILIATAFLGYVLPWGQISFWGATVITNLASTIPFVGGEVVQWLWGGYSVSNPTLNRFFPLHFIIPFIIAAASAIHLVTLHSNGSSNPTGTTRKIDMRSFHPLFSWKDLLAPSLIITLVSTASAVSPDIMIDTENFIPANPIRAPAHIQPEWYFLFAYAILRAVPNKLGGVVALILRIIVIAIPISKKTKNSRRKFKPLKKKKRIITIGAFGVLTILGAKPIEEPFIRTRKTAGIIYFSRVILCFFKICLENR